MATQKLSTSVQPQNHTDGQQPQKKESTFDSVVSKLSVNKLAVGAAVLGVSLFALSRSERVCDFTVAVADLSKEGIEAGIKAGRAKAYKAYKSLQAKSISRKLGLPTNHWFVQHLVEKGIDTGSQIEKFIKGHMDKLWDIMETTDLAKQAASEGAGRLAQAGYLSVAIAAGASGEGIKVLAQTGAGLVASEGAGRLAQAGYLSVARAAGASGEGIKVLAQTGAGLVASEGAGRLAQAGYLSVARAAGASGEGIKVLAQTGAGLVASEGAGRLAQAGYLSVARAAGASGEGIKVLAQTGAGLVASEGAGRLAQAGYLSVARAAGASGEGVKVLAKTGAGLVASKGAAKLGQAGYAKATIAMLQNLPVR